MSDPKPTDGPNVDALREQLRALGYLDARVDRFVLGPIRPGASPRRLAATASARVGLLTGLLLGPAAAIGLRARAPELVTGTADAAIVAVYLAALFAVAASVIVGLAVWIGATAARRASGAQAGMARHAARAAGATGLAVTAACLVYLTLWWRTAAPSAGSTPVWTAAALATGVGISLLLGHAVTLTVLAVLARLGATTGLRRGLPLSSRRAIIVMAILAFTGAAGLLVAMGGPATPPAQPRLTVVPNGARLTVIALDGADHDTLLRLAAAGRIPTMARWIRGAMAPASVTDSTDPARLWTTIATGQPPERHGIAALENREVLGLEGRLTPGAAASNVLMRVTDLLRLTRPSIASAQERRLPAFWEVAARAGLRTAVVHWWATWPASPESGMVISDRALLRLERGGDLNGEIAPASLYADLGRDWPERRRRVEARVEAAGITALDSGLIAAVRRSATLDATLVEIAADPTLAGLDLIAVYLPGLDILTHAVRRTPAADSSRTPVSNAQAQDDVVDRYYEFLDGLLASLTVRPDGGSGSVMLVAQPGRAGAGRGLVALSGGPAANRPAAVDVAPTAIAPTVLHALGVPVAADLPERPVLPLFNATFAARYPVRTVATYGPRFSPPRPPGQPLDQEMIERLRSLGYVR